MESAKGKYILIAGATGGIGSQTAKLLAGSGAHLFLTGRNEEKLKAVAEELRLAPNQFY
ncbi:MAG: SDR family NAD(P)-dependent oxidoreductase, partial [Chitinophagaceae bacterium]